MSFLPIIERELRVASRRRTTYWMRFFLALGVFLFWFYLLGLTPGGLPFSKGKFLFGALGTIMLSFSLLSGVFVTADCISQEQREGTLGLLFLTSLNSYDVVLGKLVANSLPAVYGCLACLPLLAYSWLIGGITGGEFWRVALAIIAALSFSLSLGILTSAFVRETRQAVGISLIMILFVGVGLPAIGTALAYLFRNQVWHVFSLPSPISVFTNAFDTSFSGPGGLWKFWGSFLTILASAVGALLLAIQRVSHSWHEKSEANTETTGQRGSGRPPLCASDSKSGRKALLDKNPFQWVANRDRRPQWIAWSVAGLLFVLWAGFLLGSLVKNGKAANFCFGSVLVVTYGFHHALKWLVAIESSRRLSEDRRSGALELLLVTPISVDQIILGQRRALRSLFYGPILVAMAMNLGLFIWLVSVDPLRIGSPNIVLLCELCLGGTIMLWVDFKALTWIGMWMALVKPRHHRAIFATLIRVMFIPWLAIFMLVVLTIGGGSLSIGTFLSLSLLWFGLAAMIEATFIARAKWALLEAFRQISADPAQPVQGLELPLRPAALEYG